jgi:hypothetical protein
VAKMTRRAAHSSPVHSLGFNHRTLRSVFLHPGNHLKTAPAVQERMSAFRRVSGATDASV